jgi:hypothetical protein
MIDRSGMSAGVDVPQRYQEFGIYFDPDLFLNFTSRSRSYITVFCIQAAAWKNKCARVVSEVRRPATQVDLNAALGVPHERYSSGWNWFLGSFHKFRQKVAKESFL